MREIQTAPAFRNKRLIKTWRLWDEQARPADFTTDQMPACQIRYVAGPVQRGASTRKPGGAATFVDELKPFITIELWTAGTDQADPLNLGDAIYDVFAVQDDKLRKELQGRLGGVGIRDWQLVQEIAPPTLEAYTDQGIYAVGSYQLTVFVNA